MIEIVIYSRPGCHLCDDMKEVVRRVVAPMGEAARIEEVDISGDADLEARYGLEIPVMVIDGRKSAKYRVSEADLRRMIGSRAG